MRFVLEKLGKKVKEKSSAKNNLVPLVGESNHLKEIDLLIKTVSLNNASILLNGERGTGKRLIAKKIHSLATENFSTFFEINCKSFSDEQIKRVFADLRHFYSFNQRITLFVNFVNELSTELQEVFLETLKSAKNSKLNLKVVCSMECEIDELLKKGTFNAELFYQLNAVVINVLPLRQRKEDIIPIAEYYLKSFSQKSGLKFSDFTPSAKIDMQEFFWKANADELINAIQRGFLVGTEPFITSEDLGIGVSKVDNSNNMTLKDAVDSFKKEYITKVLQENGWNQTKTAKILGIQRTYVIRLMNELQIRK